MGFCRDHATPPICDRLSGSELLVFHNVMLLVRRRVIVHSVWCRCRVTGWDWYLTFTVTTHHNQSSATTTSHTPAGLLHFFLVSVCFLCLTALTECIIILCSEAVVSKMSSISHLATSRAVRRTVSSSQKWPIKRQEGCLETSAALFSASLLLLFSYRIERLSRHVSRCSELMPTCDLTALRH